MRVFSFNLSDFVFVWWGLLYEAIPFVVIGALLSGFVERCLSREAVTRFLPRSRLLAILASGFLGLAFPMCECGVVPVVRRLMLKGVPVSCGVVYLLASPVINPLVMASTLIAFRSRGGWVVVGLRVASAYLVAVLVGLAVWKLLGEENVVLSDGAGARNGSAREAEEHTHASHGGVLRDILVIAASDFLLIGATLVVGAAIAALINSGFSRAAMEPFANNPWTAVSGMMGLAIALNLCSEADAFVAASFYAFPLAAKLAFLVLGPMVDVKLMLMYTTVFRPKAIVAISGTVILLVFILGVLGYVWMPRMALTGGL
jgi:uncharacterized membrane protein YraQ (UPF0718 family)